MHHIELDYSQIAVLKKKLLDSHYFEYMWHRFFEDRDVAYKDWNPAGWQHDDDSLARYHLYFQQYKHLLQRATILDIGAGLNFYSVWAMENGAHSVDYIEPDLYKFEYGEEYIALRELEHKIKGECIDINSYIQRGQYNTYDVVFLLDVLYYTANHYEIFKFIREELKPNHIFLECTVNDNDYVNAWTPSTDPKDWQSFPGSTETTALTPSREALFNTIHEAGLNVAAFYDYKNYKIKSNSIPRREGRKVFMILTPKK